MARDGKGMVGGVGRPALINPGSLLAFRARAETASPPGLTAPGPGPTPLQGQGASYPPACSGRFPSRRLQLRQPAKVSLVTFCPTVPAKLLCSGSPPADRPRPHPIPPLATAKKKSQLPWSQESPLPSFTDGEIGPERGRVLLLVTQQSQGRARIRSQVSGLQPGLCPHSSTLPPYAPPQSLAEDTNPCYFRHFPGTLLTPQPSLFRSGRIGEGHHALRARFLRAGLSLLPEWRAPGQGPCFPAQPALTLYK